MIINLATKGEAVRDYDLLQSVVDKLREKTPYIKVPK